MWLYQYCIAISNVHSLNINFKHTKCFIYSPSFVLITISNTHTYTWFISSFVFNCWCKQWKKCLSPLKTEIPVMVNFLLQGLLKQNSSVKTLILSLCLDKHFQYINIIFFRIDAVKKLEVLSLEIRWHNKGIKSAEWTH
jgi:hypothetical protein